MNAESNRVRADSPKHTGYEVYLKVIDQALQWRVDYAMLHRHCAQRRYSPAEVVDTTKTAICDESDERLISTSYAKRNRLTLRLGRAAMAARVADHVWSSGGNRGPLRREL